MITNLTLSGDMTADFGDVLFFLNLVALTVFLVTLELDRIEALCRRLIARLQRVRLPTRRAG